MSAKHQLVENRHFRGPHPLYQLRCSILFMAQVLGAKTRRERRPLLLPEKHYGHAVVFSGHGGQVIL